MIESDKLCGSFSVIIASPDDYFYELGRFHLISEENDISTYFKTKGELIGWLIDHWVDD